MRRGLAQNFGDLVRDRGGVVIAVAEGPDQRRGRIQHVELSLLGIVEHPLARKSPEDDVVACVRRARLPLMTHSCTPGRESINACAALMAHPKRASMNRADSARAMRRSNTS